MSSFLHSRPGFRRLPDGTSERLRAWLNNVAPHLGRPLPSFLAESGVDLGMFNDALDGREMTAAAASAVEAFVPAVGA